MDYITSVESNKYVISLDNLDMGLFPTYTARLDNSASLWTANLTMGTKDYFEFHVKSKSETEMSDDESVANEITSSLYESQSNLSTTKSVHRDETTICHICDIDLPAAYLTDHENSLKHKAYVKITDAVLSRSRKHILKKSIGYIQKNHSTYFCGPCASEVNLHDKNTHENSKAHKKSASLDRVLFELATLYTNHEHEDVTPSDTIDDENFAKNELDSEIEDNTVVISDINARLEEFEKKTIVNYKELSSKFGLDKLYTLSNVGNNLKISRVNGIEVIVSEDNFNGWIKFCIVCEVIVEEEKVHTFSDTHLRNIIKPLKDDNFIRNLDNSRNHCVICNKIISNTNFHIQFDKMHNDLLRQALVINENKPKVAQKDPIVNVKNQDTIPDTSVIPNGTGESLDNSNRLLQSIMAPVSKPNVTTESDLFTKIDSVTYICNPCNQEFHVNDLETHVIGNIHAMNLKSPVHYNLKRKGLHHFICRVCNAYVSDKGDKVKEHVATKDHVKKYTGVLANNHIVLRQGNFYCKPCNLVILKRNELLHIEKSFHETNLVTFKELKVKSNSSQDTNTNIGDSNAPQQAVDNKIAGVSNINQSCINNPRTDVTGYYCDVCEVKVPNNPHNIRDHNEGNRHKRNASKLLNTVEENADSIDDSESLEVHYHMDATENEKTLMCKVCKVVVPNIESNINEHVEGKKHDAAFKIIMDSNHIESVEDKYFCKLCKVNIKTHNFFKHTNQKKHLALVGREMKPETAKAVEAVELKTKEKVAEDIAVSSSKESTDVLYHKFRHNFTESEDNKTLKCKICINTDIPNTPESVVSHSRRQSHRNEYRNLLFNNLIFETEDRRYMCAICDCYVPKSGEVIHVQGTRHTENYAVVIAKEKCIVCDVDMTNGDMSKHIITPEHIYNVLCNEPQLHFCKYCKIMIKKDDEHKHRNSCHRFEVKDKICFCAQCHPYLPKSSSS